MERLQNIVDWLVCILGLLAWLGIFIVADDGAGVVYFTWLGIVFALFVVTAIRIVLWIVKPRPLISRTRLQGNPETRIVSLSSAE